MESIERLREFVGKGSRTQITTLPPIDMVTLDWRDLTKLIDEIEEEFKEQEQAYSFAYSQVYDSANGIYGQLLNFDKMEEKQDEMAEHGWVKLPVSEDGDVLHVGELVDEKLPFGGYAAPAPIDTMELSRGASGYVWMVKLDAESRALISPKLLRHHHEPTVEDVLSEFASKVCNSGHQWGLDAADTIAEYAARLQLAGDGE